MWHVDEGALHAYLDGALDEYPAAEALRVREHLETCAECGGRLAEERRVREEAQRILGLAAPRVGAPTFEELRAYVRAQEPRRSTISVRLYRLSWAASVVLAIGTGWLLRGGMPPTTVSSGEARPEANQVRPSQRAAAEADRVGGAMVPAAEEALERSSEAVEAPARLAQPPAPRGVSEVERAPAAEAGQRLEVAATPAPATLAQANRAAFADAADRDQAAAEADDEVELASGPRAADADAAPELSPPVADLERAREESRTPSQDAPRRDATPPEGRLTTAVTAPSAVAGGPAAPAPGAGGTALGRAVASVAAADAAAEAETVSLVVPGLEVLDVLPVGQGTTFAGMRALQRLQTGDTLELVHLPEGIDPASLPPLPQGWSELVRPRGSGWLVLRARAPEASLLALLQRLESGR